MHWKEEIDSIEFGDEADCLKRFAFAMTELFYITIHEWNANELVPESGDNAKALIDKAIQETWDKSKNQY